MKVNCINIVLILFLASMPVTSHSQAVTISNAVQNSKETLDSALNRAVCPPDVMYLVIDPQKVSLPENALSPSNGSSVRITAGAFGYLTQEFGGLSAIAPDEITVVNTPPDVPNPYDGMEPKQLIKLLSKSFTNDQWKSFLGANGIGYSDLINAQQKMIFGLLFPDQKLEYVSMSVDNPFDPKNKHVVSGSALTEARIRLTFLTSMGLSKPGKPGAHTFANMYEPDIEHFYIMLNSPSNDVSHEFGAQVSGKAANILKASQMPYDETCFKSNVSFHDINTVDDLVTVIGKITGKEIYADPRFGSRIVRFIGGTEAPAKDILKALAFCVGGAYRQVGPAYVLTNDIVGLGVKHALWKEFEDKAKKAISPSSFPEYSDLDRKNAAYTVKDIPFEEKFLKLTESQLKSYWEKWKQNPDRSGSGTIDITLPFDQLSDDQKNAARHIQLDNQKDNIITTLNGTVMLQAEPEVSIQLPQIQPILRHTI